MAEYYKNTIVAMLGNLSEDDLDLIYSIMAKMTEVTNG